MDKYCIKEFYNTNVNPEFFDDTPFTDEWQNEVYDFAKLFTKNLNKVTDIGCGSGYKLMKYFSGKDTIGIDLPKTVEFLKAKYPNRRWYDTWVGHETDLVICADVIEHVVEPDALLNYIKSLKPKVIVISTPDRSLLGKQDGPPDNPSHVREWTFEEFGQYMRKNFDVVDHRVTNHKQATQMVVCMLKG